MISEPSEIRSRFQPNAIIAITTTLSTSGTDNATTMPVRQPRLSRLTMMTMINASSRDFSKSQTASLDRRRLVGDALEFDAVRQLLLDVVDRGLDGLAELHDVAVVASLRSPSIRTAWPLWRTV